MFPTLRTTLATSLLLAAGVAMAAPYSGELYNIQGGNKTLIHDLEGSSSNTDIVLKFDQGFNFDLSQAIAQQLTAGDDVTSTTPQVFTFQSNQWPMDSYTMTIKDMDLELGTDTFQMSQNTNFKGLNGQSMAGKTMRSIGGTMTVDVLVTGQNSAGNTVVWTQVDNAVVSFDDQHLMGGYNGAYLDTSTSTPVFSGFLWGAATAMNAKVNGCWHNSVNFGMDLHFGGNGSPNNPMPGVSEPGTMALGGLLLLGFAVRRRRSAL
jgi:hypothetical protein